MRASLLSPFASFRMDRHHNLWPENEENVTAMHANSKLRHQFNFLSAECGKFSLLLFENKGEYELDAEGRGQREERGGGGEMTMSVTLEQRFFSHLDIIRKESFAGDLLLNGSVFQHIFIVR